MLKLFIHIICCLIPFGLVAQTGILNPQLPNLNPAIPSPHQHFNNPGYRPANPHNSGEFNDIRQRNEAMIREDMAQMREIIQRQKMIQTLAEKGFPSQSEIHPEGTAYYRQAFDEILNMLQGKVPLNLGRAVFAVENAYYENALDYSDFQNAINEQVKICNQKIKEEKLDGNNNLVKNMMLFRLISDTLTLKPQGKERTVTHLPVKYDLDDYKSEKNFDSHFVTKLMRSGSGQCVSMPLYYLVLAEAAGAEAYRAFSPQHTFVKIKDDKGVWYNLELTCNAILSDVHYMNSSYMKVEAIRNRIYLEPMDRRETIAELLLELARGYYTKYGLDDFYLQCSFAAEQFLKNDLHAIMNKAIYETRLTLTLANLLDARNPELLKEKSAEAYSHYERMQELYRQIDNLGYEELPEGVYERWLEHINKLKTEDKRKIILNKQ